MGISTIKEAIVDIKSGKMIINAGIVRIVIREGYRDELAEEMLAEAKIEVIRK